MTLDELLAHCAARRLILSWSRRGRLVLWSPNKKVPRPIRAAIVQHRDELECLVATDDIAVCPAHRLHFQSWVYHGGGFKCGICQRVRLDRDV